MKKVVLSLAIVALLALPAMAEFNCPRPDSDDPCVGANVQGYVDGTASYQAGCVEQQSCEVGVKEVCNVSTSGKVTDFNSATRGCTEVEALPNSRTSQSCDPAPCQSNINQSSWDASLTKTETCSLFKEQVDGKFAVGSAAMNSLGGVSVCASNAPAITAYGNVSNSHAIDQTATVSACRPGCEATASYVGSQNLNLTVNKAAR